MGPQIGFLDCSLCVCIPCTLLETGYASVSVLYDVIGEPIGLLCCDGTMPLHVHIYRFSLLLCREMVNGLCERISSSAEL